MLHSTKDTKPAECVTAVVSPELSVLIPVHELPDLSTELLKLDKDIAQLAASIKSLQQSAAHPAYGTRTPDKVKASHVAKLEQMQAQRTRLSESLTQLLQLAPRRQLKLYFAAKLAAAPSRAGAQ